MAITTTETEVSDREVAPADRPTSTPTLAGDHGTTMLRRRHGVRMSCARCEVAWTGDATSTCWFCEGPGVPGPPPSIYPDIT